MNNPKISYLWFGGPDGWQVTSFDPKTDPAIGVDRSRAEYVDRAAYEALRERYEQTEALLNEIREFGVKQILKVNSVLKALEFYADPETYFAIGFSPDPPCGDFITDTDKEEPGKPGARARRALKEFYEGM